MKRSNVGLFGGILASLFVGLAALVNQCSVPPVPPNPPIMIKTYAEYLSVAAEDATINSYSTVYANALATARGCSSAETRAVIGQLFSGSTFDIYKSFLRFDTSSIPDTATVTTATLRLCSAGDSSLHNDFEILVFRYPWNYPACDNREPNWDGASGITATQEGAIGNTATGWVSGTCYYLELNPDGVNTTGQTYYTVLSSRTVNEQPPDATYKYEFGYHWTGDYSIAGMKPQLSLDYDSGAAPVAPTAAMSALPATGYAPLTVYVTDTSTYVSGTLSLIHWDWQGSSTAGITVTNHTFSSAGNYTITMYITDTYAQSANCIKVITVTATSGPTAVISNTPSTGYTPLTVYFTDTSTAGASGTINAWQWDFGDAGTEGDKSAATQNASHVYNDTGNFVITLYVTDTNTNGANATRYITVTSETTPIPAVTTGLPRVVWVQNDGNDTDWSNPGSCNGDFCGNMGYGAIGGLELGMFTWDDIELAQGDYVWNRSTWGRGSPLYDFLFPATAKTVTLDDGTTINKPKGFGILLQDDGGPFSGGPAGITSYYGVDYSPAYVKALAPSVYMTTTGCAVGMIRPNYEDSDWSNRYQALVSALGTEFNDDTAYPDLHVIIIYPGFGGESTVGRSHDCFLYAGAGAGPTNGESSAYQTLMNNMLWWYDAAFDSKTVFFNATQGDTKAMQLLARQLNNKTVGIKNNGWMVDKYEDNSYEYGTTGALLGGATGFSIGTDRTGITKTYEIIPTGLEPGSYESTPQFFYWMIMGGLSVHPHFFDIQYQNLQFIYTASVQSSLDLFEFMRQYQGRVITNTPGVWITFRDTIYNDWGWCGSITAQGQGCTKSGGIPGTYLSNGGHKGAFSYWLTEDTGVSTGKSVTMTNRAVVPTYVSATTRSGIINQVYNMWQYNGTANEPLLLGPPQSGYTTTIYPRYYYIAKRTDHASGNDYIFLDIEDTLPATQYKPTYYDSATGVTWYITVTYADAGTDSWFIQYYNWEGGLESKEVVKTNTKTWKDAVFVLDRAYMGNKFDSTDGSGNDLRLYNNADGDDVFHRVIITPVLAGSAPAVTNPVAAFSYTPVAGVITLTVHVTDTTAYGTYPASLYHWDWGDSTSPATTATANHDYTRPGAFVIGLWVTNTGYLSDYISHTVNALQTSVGPTATFSFTPETGQFPVTVYVTDTSTAGAVAIAARHWDWGDSTPAATAASANHQYTRAAVFTIQLWVTDTDSLSSYTTHQVTITAPPYNPVVSLSCPAASHISEDMLVQSGIYTLTCHLAVAEDVTITLQQGTEIRFDAGKKADIRGNLYAVGTTGAGGITFTQKTGGTSTQAYWDYLRIWGGASNLYYVNVLYSRGVNDALGSTIRYSSFLSNTYGLATMGATDIASSTLRYNGTNLLCYSIANPTIDRVNILDQTGTWNVNIDQPGDVYSTNCWFGADPPDSTKIRDDAWLGGLGAFYYSPNAAAIIGW